MLVLNMNGMCNFITLTVSQLVWTSMKPFVVETNGSFPKKSEKDKICE